MYRIAFIRNTPTNEEYNISSLKNNFLVVSFEDEYNFVEKTKKTGKVDAIIVKSDLSTKREIARIKFIEENLSYFTPIILLVPSITNNLRIKAMELSIAEIMEYGNNEHQLELRLNYIINFYNKTKSPNKIPVRTLKIPLDKRIFDIALSGTAILLLSPLFILITILIKIESKGPAIYKSKRVGSGYKIFNFYKFRSMRADADKRLKDLAHLNQYKQQAEAEIIQDKCSECREHNLSCSSLLYLDHEVVCEKIFLSNKKIQNSSAFLKIKDDPRVTRVGKFIRNSSIDELPQLFNVLLGDMSIVGNRPLPLYEAEKITTDKYSERFIAPAFGR